MKIKPLIRKHPRRTIVLGFLFTIIFGALILTIPLSLESGRTISFIDSLFTSTSAVCVTGLVAVDTGNTFSVLGETVIALLIQIGGLGITSIGIIAILLTNGRVGIGSRKLAQESFNLSTAKDLRIILRGIFNSTIIIELVGAACSFLTFSQHYELKDAVGISLFHSVASFNNAGFDVFGGFGSLARYAGDPWLLIITALLIILGGMGFFVFMDVLTKRSFKKLTLHSKIVLSTTAVLLAAGTVLIKLSEGIPWLLAFFDSATTRTAGFAVNPIGQVSTAGLLIMIMLMFIGASPGSTGGGIKTTTTFVLLANFKAVAYNKYCTAFKRKISDQSTSKAMIVVILASLCICISTMLISFFQPEYPLHKVLFEVVSGFATVGLTTGITPTLCTASKIVLIVTMFIGRLGPLTLITLWWMNEKPSARYSEEEVNIG